MRSFTCDKVQVAIYPSRATLGLQAAKKAAEIIQAAVAKRGRARIIVATGNSQLDFIGALVKQKEIAWPRVEMFHMDEYIGLPPQHPASFRLWLKTRVEDKLPLAEANYICGDAPDVEAEIVRYSALLAAGPIDCSFVGFGENGHIAFNDPPSADFDDPVSQSSWAHRSYLGRRRLPVLQPGSPRAMVHFRVRGAPSKASRQSI